MAYSCNHICLFTGTTCISLPMLFNNCGHNNSEGGADEQ